MLFMQPWGKEGRAIIGPAYLITVEHCDGFLYFHLTDLDSGQNVCVIWNIGIWIKDAEFDH